MIMFPMVENGPRIEVLLSGIAVGFLGLILIAGLSSEKVRAQGYADPSERSLQRESSRSSAQKQERDASSLPSWAEPSSRSSQPASSERTQDGYSTGQTNGGYASASDPNDPPSADSIPIDGKLKWLMVVGLVFGIYRLHGKQNEG